MKLFKVGDKARIISVPEKDKHWLNEVVTVVETGGFPEDDDIMAMTATKQMLPLKESQLTKIDK